jgi:hypothetical protein
MHHGKAATAYQSHHDPQAHLHGHADGDQDWEEKVVGQIELLLREESDVPVVGCPSSTVVEERPTTSQNEQNSDGVSGDNIIDPHPAHIRIMSKKFRQGWGGYEIEYTDSNYHAMSEAVTLL